MPRFLRRERWSLKPPFHPCPHLSARAVFSLWHCLSASPCVVTSRVYLRPDRSYAAPCPMEFGLSSRNLRRERPSALPRRVQDGGWMRVWRVGSFPIARAQCPLQFTGCSCIEFSEDKKRAALDRNGCGEAGFVSHIPASNPVRSLAFLRTHITTKRTQVMKTLKLSVILALASAVFGATALSAAHSPRGAANGSAKSAKGHCDSKGGACCKKDCKK